MEQLDQTDITILRILQKDSKKTAKEIAAILNLTPSPVYERVRRLEKQGVIKKYVAILDKKQIDRSITVICQVSMRYHNEAFIEVDFILKIHTKSLEEYHDFVKTKLSKIENIGVLNSTFVLKEIKHSSEYYI